MYIYSHTSSRCCLALLICEESVLPCVLNGSSRIRMKAVRGIDLEIDAQHTRSKDERYVCVWCIPPPVPRVNGLTDVLFLQYS